MHYICMFSGLSGVQLQASCTWMPKLVQSKFAIFPLLRKPRCCLQPLIATNGCVRLSCSICQCLSKHEYYASACLNMNLRMGICKKNRTIFYLSHAPVYWCQCIPQYSNALTFKSTDSCTQYLGFPGRRNTLDFILHWLRRPYSKCFNRKA